MKPSERDRRILAVYTETKSMLKTASVVGVSYTWVNRVVHRYGQLLNQRGGQKQPTNIPAPIKTIVAKRYLQGQGSTSLGRDFGYPAALIRKALREDGVVIRPPLRLTPLQKEEFIRLYREKMPLREIAERISCSADSLNMLLHRMKCKRRDRAFVQRRFSESEELEIVQLYRCGKTTVELATEFSCWPGLIWGIIRHRGERCRPQSEIQRHYTLQCDYFDVIDTEDKAYWLGFITADGALTTEAASGKKVYYLRIALQRRDRAHLEAFQKAIGTNAPIYDYMTRPNKTTKESKSASGITVSSKQMVQALVRYGLTQRKSLTVEWWNGPADLMRHYARGVFDGDGCLCSTKVAGRKEPRWSFSLIGSIPLIQGFIDWTSPFLSHPMRLRYRTPDKTAYVATAGIHRAATLTKLLYEGATISLDRKRALADQLLDFATTRTQPCQNPLWASGEQR